MLAGSYYFKVDRFGYKITFLIIFDYRISSCIFKKGNKSFYFIIYLNEANINNNSVNNNATIKAATLFYLKLK